MDAFERVLGLVLLLACVVSGQHRQAPPGVNPQQYQGQQQQQQFQQMPPQQQQQQFQGQPPPPPPQHQGQFQGQVPQQQFQGQVPQQQFQGQVPQQQQFQPPPPPQQQQMPVQHQQQVPVQQQQQPGQVPVQHAQQPRGAGGHHQPQQKVLHKDMSHEKEHMKEHMDVPIDTSNMSEQELQFHYFKMHDSDGNNKLDGCELVKSLIHWHDSSNHDKSTGQNVPEEKNFKDDELVAMIDPILATDDKNQDGYIDYSEFVIAQQAAQTKSEAAV